MNIASNCFVDVELSLLLSALRTDFENRFGKLNCWPVNVLLTALAEKGYVSVHFSDDGASAWIMTALGKQTAAAFYDKENEYVINDDEELDDDEDEDEDEDEDDNITEPSWSTIQRVTGPSLTEPTPTKDTE